MAFVTLKCPKGGRPMEEVKEKWGIKGALYVLQIGYCEYCGDQLYIPHFALEKVRDKIDEMLSSREDTKSVKEKIGGRVMAFLPHRTYYKNTYSAEEFESEMRKRIHAYHNKT